MEEVFAVYIWSNQWWTFTGESWNAQAATYEDSLIVDGDNLNWSRVSDGEAYHASLYFEMDKEDAHGFTPTAIMVDNVDNPTTVLIQGTTDGREGGDLDGAEIVLTEISGLTEYYEAGNVQVEFTVNEIIAARTEEEKENLIVSFIESQNEADMATVESMSSETFNAPRKTPTKRQMRRSNRSRKSKNLMQQKRFMKDKRPKDYSTTGYAETLAAESFASESASDAIAAESSKAVEGINPTPVSDGQWLAETISKQAEAKHSYPHRVIDGDDYVHYDGKGRQTRRTNRGKSVKADRRRYTPNSNLKPGQGHRGDFVREAQGYNDRMDESLGMSHPGRHSQTMGDRRRESAGMERSMNRRKYSRVGTMDRGDRFMSEGYNARLDESMGERNRGRHHGNMTMKDRRDMSEGMARHMGSRKYSNVGTMDRTNRMMAESNFDKLSKEIEDDYVAKGMSREEASEIGDSTAAKMGRAKYGKKGMARKARKGRRAESHGMSRYLRRRAESPMTSPEEYSPMGSFSTDMNPKTAAPTSAGTGDQIISVDSPSAPPSNIKFAEDHPDFDPRKADRDNDGKISSWERKVGNAVAKGMAKEAEFGVVGNGSNFGQDLMAENWCTKHSETFEACGCEKEDKRAEPSGSQPTNEMASGDDPLDDATLSGFDIVNVDSPSAPPSDVFVQSAEMNYDGSLYGDQYFPDAMTANQVGVGKLGSANSAPDSGQGVLQWDGSREGPDLDTKASEVATRRGLKFVGSVAALVGGGYLLLNNLKKE
tara:strand:- start:4112 stop:6412 length:2301 start_codon:yes stop_codon:yes gene_type:complete